MVDFEGFVASKNEDYVTEFAPPEALKLIAWGNLTFDERVVVHRVVGAGGLLVINTDASACLIFEAVHVSNSLYM